MILLIFREDFSFKMLRYFLFYKPFNVLNQFSAADSKQTLADWLKVPRDVYPVGRLDYDSEGFLILTNDKNLHYRLLDPKFRHEREYWVQVDNYITDEAIRNLEKGVDIRIDGQLYHTLPCQVKRLPADLPVPERNPPVRFRKLIPTSWISIRLTEGKNRQVRKMTAAVGFPTLRLIRYRIEDITIDNFQPGTYREINRDEIYRLTHIAG